MHFPVAGIDATPWLPPLAAFAVSFLTSMGGVSGAFLLLPFQVSVLGYTAPSVSATNQVFNIVAIPSGVWRYLREGRMVWPLAWVVILGTLPGVLIGAVVRVAWLPDPRHFKLFAALVMAYIGLRMIRDLFRRNGNNHRAEARFQALANSRRSRNGGNHDPLPVVVPEPFSLRRIAYTFHGERYQCSTPAIFLLSLVVGVVGGIYGIGGGSIIAPFFVSVFGLPVYTVAGAALMGTFVTSVAGVIFYQAIAPLWPHVSVAPDWLLGLLFGIGGMAGMYLGARCQKFIPAKIIKAILMGIILLTAAKYVIGFFA